LRFVGWEIRAERLKMGASSAEVESVKEVTSDAVRVRELASSKLE